MRLHRTVLAFIALALPLILPARAPAGPTLDYYLPAGTAYHPMVATPEAFFGFQVGEWHLTPERLAAYMHELAEHSERASLIEYARSYENRPLQVLVLTSAENQGRLEEIRARHLLLSDPDRSGNLALDDMPVVVYMGYSIHGNEASGANASALVAYHLAAALDAGVQDALEQTIVLLDPCMNPDGLSRFAHWANMHRGHRLVADPASREHNEIWPSGRTNHYWFDLNRDWLLVQHPESRGRVGVFHDWRPVLLTDHHEMGRDATYFFQPGVPSRNNPLTPAGTFTLTADIAEHHARALDRLGALYYTKESFDDFYIGKGSTYPDVNGAVGILFEQASVRGHLTESAHGERDFPFAVRNQVATSLSTLEAANEMRTELLAHHRDFYRTAISDADDWKTKGYVFGDGGDPARWYEFVKMLQTHRVRVHELARRVDVGGERFELGDAWVVPFRQPQHRLARAMFEQRTSFADSIFYDVSAWTVPLAFGLPGGEIGKSGVAGDLLPPVAFPTLAMDDAADPYAWVFSWSNYYAPRVLYHLLDADVIASVATRPFRAQTSDGLLDFDYGSIVVSARGQADKADTIRAILAGAADSSGVRVHAVATGLTPDGINLGSPRLVPVKKPEVAVVVGDGVSSYQAGAAWHLLDRRYHVPVSLLDTKRLKNVDLDRYTAIVLPSGRYGGEIKPLYDWVKEGGTLVALGSAAKKAIQDSLVFVELLEAEEDSTVTRRAYADLDRDRGAEAIGGAIFAAELDRTHPIGFGYAEETLSVFRRGDVFLKPPDNPYATPLRYADEPLVAGYISDRNADVLAGSAGIVVAAVGRGRIVLFADQPNFRAYWYGTNKLFANAVFFGAIVDAAAAEIERPDEAPK